MSGKPLGMLDFHPAEPKLLAFGETVNVIAHARAHGGQCHAFILQVFGKGHFFQPLVTRHQRHGKPPRFGHGGIIARIGCTAPSAVGGKDRAETEGLRGLHAVEPVALDKRAAQAIGPAHHAVHHRQHGNGARIRVQRRYQRFDHRRGQIRPRCIVDQYMRRRIARQRFQPRSHRTLTARRAMHQTHARHPSQRIGCHRFPVRRDHHHDRRHTGFGQRHDRMAHERLAPPQRELLRYGAARAQTLPGGDDDSGNGSKRQCIHASPLTVLAANRAID